MHWEEIKLQNVEHKSNCNEEGEGNVAAQTKMSRLNVKSEGKSEGGEWLPLKWQSAMRLFSST